MCVKGIDQIIHLTWLEAVIYTIHFLFYQENY